MKQKKPLLSIGIIFKNEIRCLERCLESLKPLREAVPCELVMADTGSDDGSREVAAKYADILFDFLWIDDFSAARNAVMDRCSGDWYLSIDADEWLDPNIEELLKFLTRQHNFNFFGVKVRNYKSEDLEAGGLYMDSHAHRMVRMSTGKRFQDVIHENWDTEGQPIVMLSKTMFYHDGYVYAEPGSRGAKEERNLEMLRKVLEEDPDNLGLLLQGYESSYLHPEEHLDYIRRAIQGVEEKYPRWKRCGPAIYRHGVAAAFSENLPELDQWIARAEELFPDSIITRLDVNHTALGLYWNRGDFAGCVRRGEAYFEAVKDYESNNFNVQDVTASPPLFASMSWQQTARGFLAGAYLAENRPGECAQTLEEMSRHPLDEKQTEECVRALVRLHMLTELDTAPLVLALWERVNEPVPTKEAAEKRRETFDAMSRSTFKPDFRLEEGGTVLRPGFSVFEPLENLCVVGRAAAILGTDNPESLSEKLAAVEEWDELLIPALAHALRHGARFPLPGQPLNVEQMDVLAYGLVSAGSQEDFFQLVLDTVQNEALDDPQTLLWVRGLVLAAVGEFNWRIEKPQDDEIAVLDLGVIERGKDLARAFAEVERRFLPLCYAPAALEMEGLPYLPPLHRFGWYCAQAFEALNAGKPTEYVQLLRRGLKVDKDAKHMVQFLVDCTPEVQLPPPSKELLALAEQIRTVLANFAPDDPAVTVLKASEAYQKVAYLIEGIEPPIVGGLPQ